MAQKPKITFAPGALDSFEGTQEELDELVAQITEMFESGDYADHIRPVDLDNDEDLAIVAKAFEKELSNAKRKLQ
jgi:hypothetical protein